MTVAQGLMNRLEKEGFIRPPIKGKRYQNDQHANVQRRHFLVEVVVLALVFVASTNSPYKRLHISFPK